MRVSAKAEYACIAMLELAAGSGRPGPARISDIARAHDIPQRFLVQIMLQLKTAGLVTSVRGPAGGYKLAQSGDKITLANILRAMDGKTLSEPNIRNGKTGSALKEALLTAWKEVQHEEERILDRLTLVEMVRRATSPNSLSYQI